MRFYVEYRVEGVDRVLRAGPYTRGAELEYHLHDIESYQHVSDVHITRAPDDAHVETCDCFACVCPENFVGSLP